MSFSSSSARPSGWQEGPDPKRRKERDWLTQSQLMRRTGRASGAVSRAVDALVRGGLIDVLDPGGRTADDSCGAAADISVGSTTVCRRGQDAGPGIERPKTAHAKPRTTKESKYKNIRA